MPPKRKSKSSSKNPKPRSPKGSARPASETSARRVSPPAAPTQRPATPAAPKRKTSSLLDTRVIFCGDNLQKLADFPDAAVDLIYIDPPFNSNRNYEVFWGETREKRSFEDRHASTAAYLDFMRPRFAEFARPRRKGAAPLAISASAKTVCGA